uniref:Ig-like domain-containing protein n=1 Tax=Cyprinus carpio TaxID=7962 RepID=A0A8C2E2Z0_CYPCA
MTKVLVCLTGTHSLRYFYTGVSGVSGLPELTVVGLVDDQQFMYFDSNTKKAVPKTEWMRQSEGADYWDEETQNDNNYHKSFKNNIQVAKERFNQTTGVHTVQVMYGCEFDDQTGETDVFHQYGYDGEDFLDLDLKEMRWITPVMQGIPTVQKWNNNGALLEKDKHYFNTVCIEWLQKYVQYEKSSLKKTVSPQVSLLQKSSSSSVKCHATGFFPSGVTISWQKNGQEHHEDVYLGELLPNEDGTFQRTSTIRVSPEMRSGLTRSVPIGIIVGARAAVVLLVIIGVAGYMVYQKKKGEGSDDGSNSSPHTDPHNTNVSMLLLVVVYLSQSCEMNKM